MVLLSCYGWHAVIVFMACLAHGLSQSEYNDDRIPCVTGKPALIRTELRFARNLDPSKVQVVNVKSSKGDNVEILVGKNSHKARAADADKLFFVRNAYLKRPLNPPMGKDIAFQHSPALLKQSELALQNTASRQRKVEAEQRQAKLIQLQLAKTNSKAIEYQAVQYGSRHGRKLAMDLIWKPVQTNAQLLTQKNNSLASNLRRQSFDVHDTVEILPRRQRKVLGSTVGLSRDIDFIASDFQEYRDNRAYDKSGSSQGYQPQNLITKHNFESLPQESKFVTYVPHSLVVTSMGVDLPAYTRHPENIGGYESPHHNPIGQSMHSVVDGPAITLIEGVRVPDSAEDKTKTWRNARVLNNRLVPYPDGYTPPRVQMPSFER
ncbi:uncharacterized protein LOC108117639 [Drosophila eugracilis]|uniref:uncharacterized protein LOC108117639 n=1 Tax=Drosophila eugracilis TaxID=29029 RepID=UPI0007E7024E|nr:uncharacterized protein LOC108117639 [Drosophila eugracilis]XP_017085670.1 uncharacterized protein LOC108117639 [Drosophila eugracilis]